MPNEQDTASQNRLKWWHFRFSSPIVVGTIVGMFSLGMLSPPTVRPHTPGTPYVNGLEAMLIGAVGGLVVGAIAEIVWLRRGSRS